MKWSALRIGEVRLFTQDGTHRFEAQLYLDALDPDALRVELYANGLDGRPPERLAMQRVRQLIGAPSGYAYALELLASRPVERVIARQHGRDVHREEIVEVGNLAATGNASARLLIVALTDLLISKGFRWVAFTGTRALLNSFGRLGLTPLLSQSGADGCRAGRDWGSYYANRPQGSPGEA